MCRAPSYLDRTLSSILCAVAACLAQACPLFLQLKDSIIARGRAKAEQKGKAELERQELWRIGMPKRTSGPVKGAKAPSMAADQERPSLAKLSRTLLNARAAFRNRG